MIIFRYLFKEVLSALAGVTLVLLVLFLSNQLVRYLSYAAAGKIPASILMRLMGFEIPYLLALLLPLGLYLGIILAYGRLYADSEMPVLHACGLGAKRLVTMTAGVTVLVASAVFVLVLWVNPWIATLKAKGLTQDNVIETLQPGRFQVINKGHNVVYVEKLSRNHRQANNIFIAQQKPQAKGDTSSPAWVVVSAKNAYQEHNTELDANFIVAAEGYRYDGVPGHNDYKIMQFKKYAVRMPLPIADNAHIQEEAIPSRTLWQQYNKVTSAAELQWRLSMPLSAIILALIAIPLSQVKPRQGRYSHLLPAILIYIVYVNLLFVARNWVDVKVMPISIGMWWVHGVMFVFALVLLCVHARIQWRGFFRNAKQGQSA